MGFYTDVMLTLVISVAMFTGLMSVTWDVATAYGVPGITNITDSSGAFGTAMNITTQMQAKVEQASLQDNIIGIAGIMLGFVFDGLRLLFALPGAVLGFMTIFLNVISATLGIPTYITALVGTCITIVSVMKMYEIIRGKAEI